MYCTVSQYKSTYSTALHLIVPCMSRLECANQRRDERRCQPPTSNLQPPPTATRALLLVQLLHFSHSPSLPLPIFSFSLSLLTLTLTTTLHCSKRLTSSCHRVSHCATTPSTPPSSPTLPISVTPAHSLPLPASFQLLLPPGFRLYFHPGRLCSASPTSAIAPYALSACAYRLQVNSGLNPSSLNLLRLAPFPLRTYTKHSRSQKSFGPR